MVICLEYILEPEFDASSRFQKISDDELDKNVVCNYQFQLGFVFSVRF